MTEPYDPKTLEPAVRERWHAAGIDRADDAAERRYYCLSMFPYPSGRLHMGHVRNYTISDVITRYHRMRGISVLHPMGWDAFGLPAENAAIKHGVPPAEWTRDNIAYMRSQLQSLGLSIDWQRELATCDPDYYRWNQWLFLRMLEAGIAYKKTGTVNWDPVDRTVLANEQVIDGRGWRTGAEVVKREIPMYYLGITRYAQELLEALDGLDGWPERVRTMQANWIGRSEGVEITFPCDAGDIRVFTTRADTLMGATYLAVAPEHPLAARAAGDHPELSAFIAECRRGGVSEADIAMLEKKGMDTGHTARHPLSGDELPVWVANYVLMGYGEGAVMAVPGHDQRDFEFANKYGLPIRQVVTTGDEPEYDHREWQDWYAARENIRLIHSGPYDGLDFAAGVEAIGKALEEHGLGKRRVQFRLRDWGISRQRYWGCPIPIIHCDDCGDVPVPDEDLPVVLPEDLVPDGSGSPLARHDDFIHCECPRCGRSAKRETDTMDTFVDSAWYFMRYACADNDAAMVDERVDAWMPVDQYVGGIEHAILHLLYARFWTKVMRDLGLVAADEPFRHLLTQGMVLNHIWSRRTEAGGLEYFNPDEVTAETDDQGRIVGGRLTADGSPVDYDGMGTMSKSRNNGVDPQSLVDRYGADTVRLFTMFAAPPEQSLEWSDAGVEGAWRFLRRLWQQVDAHAAGGVEPDARPKNPDGQARELRRKLHATIGKVSDDIARRYTFNTAIAAIMELVNDLGRFGPDGDDDRALCQEAWETVTRLLAPVAPHIAEGLWARLGHETSIFAAGWPAVDESALERDAVTIVVQVNGKVRGRVEAAPGSERADLERIALADDNVARFVDGKTVRKVVVVPDKLVNIVAQ